MTTELQQAQDALQELANNVEWEKDCGCDYEGFEKTYNALGEMEFTPCPKVCVRGRTRAYPKLFEAVFMACPGEPYHVECVKGTVAVNWDEEPGYRKRTCRTCAGFGYKLRPAQEFWWRVWAPECQEELRDLAIYPYWDSPDVAVRQCHAAIIIIERLKERLRLVEVP